MNSSCLMKGDHILLLLDRGESWIPREAHQNLVDENR